MSKIFCTYDSTTVAVKKCDYHMCGKTLCSSCGYTDEHQEEDLGLCSSCSTELEPIMENNGFAAPDPTHYEITGYEPCRECKGGNHEQKF